MLLTTNEEALLAVSTYRGSHSSSRQHQLNPPASYQESGIQHQEGVRAAEWFNIRFGFLYCGEKGINCTSYADGKGNTENLLDSKGRESTLSAQVCAHVRCEKSFFFFLHQDRKPLNTQTIFSWSQQKRICLLHCVANTLLSLQGKLFAVCVGVSSLRTWQLLLRRQGRELLPLISYKATSSQKTHSSISKQRAQNPLKHLYPWDMMLHHYQPQSNVSANHLPCLVPHCKIQPFPCHRSLTVNRTYRTKKYWHQRREVLK